MKNKLSDLNDHLFAAIEKLADDDLEGDRLEMEIKRAKAIEGIAKTVIQNGELVLEGMRFTADYSADDDEKTTLALPAMFGGQ